MPRPSPTEFPARGRRVCGWSALVGLCALVSCVLMEACDAQGSDAAAATELAEPHLAHFGTFDAWARRALVADPAIRSRPALEEAIFAPVRREEEVLGAWVARDGAGPTLSFGHLPDPPVVSFRTVRGGDLGDIEVAADKVPDPRAAFDEGAPRPRSVVLRLTRPDDDGVEVTVTVAYRAVH